MKDVPLMILKALNRDLKDSYGVSGDDFINNVISVVESSGKRFVFVIDEWDAVIRECKDDIYAQKAYVALLREWFKNGNFTPKAVAAAYMTGILPIKKFGSQSELNDFNEYTMIKPYELSQFVGFTEDEVKEICLKRNVDFEKMKFWYDGYSYPEVGTIYNPYSVMRASEYNDFSTHWVQTVSPYALDEIIDRDYDGLQKAVAELVGGIEVKVNTDGFANDLVSFKGKDDVLTLLAHLGYLAYNRETETLRIPNEEIRKAFHYSIHFLTAEEGRKRLERSEKLFEDTITMNEEAVAGAVESVHSEETSSLHYNREESLRSVIQLAYYTYRDHYMQFEELPSGDGAADIVYIPLPDSGWPMLVVELKWNKSASGAIAQILDKKYPSLFNNYSGDILLVGINYDKNDKKHTAKIMEYKIK